MASGDCRRAARVAAAPRRAHEVPGSVGAAGSPAAAAGAGPLVSFAARHGQGRAGRAPDPLFYAGEQVPATIRRNLMVRIIETIPSLPSDLPQPHRHSLSACAEKKSIHARVEFLRDRQVAAAECGSFFHEKIGACRWRTPRACRQSEGTQRRRLIVTFSISPSHPSSPSVFAVGMLPSNPVSRSGRTASCRAAALRHGGSRGLERSCARKFRVTCRHGPTAWPSA